MSEFEQCPSSTRLRPCANRWYSIHLRISIRICRKRPNRALPFLPEPSAALVGMGAPPRLI
jgi:hypothetical protein